MLYGAISAAPAAIHNDMAEAYDWGREFQLGYFQHPPFWAWIAGLWFEVFPAPIRRSRCRSRLMPISAFTARGC
jgi:hypothetical protein